MIEIWKDIEGYDGLYQVSNFGRVKSFWRGGRIIKPSFSNCGYLCTCLCRDGKPKTCTIHRLVAAAFIPNPDGKPQVNHINGIKSDNRVENLEWATASENQRHAYAIGLKSTPQGEEHPEAKLTNEQAVYIRENPDGLSTVELAQVFGICHRTVSRIQLGQNYHGAGGLIRTTRLPNPLRISDEVREQIRAEYQPNVRGCGCPALARKYGVCWKTIWNIINEK